MMAIVKQQWRRGNINRENRLFPFCYVIEDDKNMLFYSVLERCSQKYILPLIYEEVFINYNNLTYPAICIASTKPVEWVVVYMRVRGIDFNIRFHNFPIRYWNCSHSIVFCFILLHCYILNILSIYATLTYFWSKRSYYYTSYSLRVCSSNWSSWYLDILCLYSS